MINLNHIQKKLENQKLQEMYKEIAKLEGEL